MPKYGPHFRGIERKVHSKIKELELVPKYVFDPKIHQERFYTAPCTNKEGKKVVFKMRAENFSETREYFRREIEINRIFTKCYEKRGKLSVPKFIQGDSEHTPEWMVYEFIEGYEAGDFYNGLLKENLGKFSIDSFVSALKNTRKMSAFAKGEINLETEGGRSFQNAYGKYSSVLIPFFSAEQIARGKEILCSSGQLLDKESIFIAHGDLHPGNVVITSKGKIAIIDWYCVHLNNMAFDLAFFYLEVCDKPFGKKLLESFLNQTVKDQELFWQLFRLDVIRLAPQKISILRDALYVLKPEKKDYYSRLTPRGISKLENLLSVFERALEGRKFL